MGSIRRDVEDEIPSHEIVNVLRDERFASLESIVWTDSELAPLVTYLFSIYYHGTALPRLVELADGCAARYDLVFLCDTDIPYEDTWDRSGEVTREMFQKRIIADLRMRRTPHYVLRGNLETRMQTVMSVLARHNKFDNPLAPYL